MSKTYYLKKELMTLFQKQWKSMIFIKTTQKYLDIEIRYNKYNNYLQQK